MKVFVTGGSGFVGRNLIGELRGQGATVRALARSDKAIAAVEAAGAEPVRGDLDDGSALREGMRGCEAVYHSAAHVDLWGDPAVFHRINVVGTERMLSSALEAGVRRFVHVGTEAVLAGGRPIVRADESWPLPERPSGLYPLTKGLAERRVLAASCDRMAAMSVRPRLIWGAGDSSVLPQFVEAVRKGRFAWIGEGRHLTSTCHVRNVCEGLILAAQRGRGGEAYFLTDGPPLPMREFLTPVLRTQGIEAPSRNLPRKVAGASAWLCEAIWRGLRLQGRPPIDRTSVLLFGEECTVEDAKARRELGYVGRLPREAGLREMAEARAISGS